MSETVDLSRFFVGYQGAFGLFDVTANRTIRHNPARCARRVSPCSTFKIFNSLLFLETGVIHNENQVEKWDGKKRPVAEWNRDQTLKSAYAVSAVWYYQRLAARVSPQTTQRYVHAVGYGNQQVPAGFNNRLPHYWLDGPLQISPDEQVAFLTRVQRGDVPFSRRTQAIVRRIMVQQKAGNAVLRGKTGTAGSREADIATMGWYVGYLEKAGRPYIFAANMTGGKNPTGRKVREIVKTILKSRDLLP